MIGETNFKTGRKQNFSNRALAALEPFVTTAMKPLRLTKIAKQARLNAFLLDMKENPAEKPGSIETWTYGISLYPSAENKSAHIPMDEKEMAATYKPEKLAGIVTKIMPQLEKLKLTVDNVRVITDKPELMENGHPVVIALDINLAEMPKAAASTEEVALEQAKTDTPPAQRILGLVSPEI